MITVARAKDTSWHDDFLRLVRAGADFKSAARQIGTTARTVHSHLKQDDDFRAQADQARREAEMANGWTGRADTSWHGKFLALVAAGLTLRQAAVVLGVTTYTVAWHRHTYPAFKAALAAAVARRGSPMPDLSSSTLGYEAEPGDVEAAVADIARTPDLMERYARASAEQAHHDAVSAALADERARVCAEWWDGGTGLSYARIGDLIGASRSRAQQLVERGRALSAR